MSGASSGSNQSSQIIELPPLGADPETVNGQSSQIIELPPLGADPETVSGQSSQIIELPPLGADPETYRELGLELEQSDDQNTKVSRHAYA